MKFYVPRCQLGVGSQPQTEAVDKFGGLPWGFPVDRWPLCGCCNKSMSLIAQLYHHDARMDLGRTGRCLAVFMCSNADSCCDATWDSSEGGNYSLLIEPEDLSDGTTHPPDLPNPETAEIRCSQNCAYDQKWDPNRTIWIQPEVRVWGWEEREDDVPHSEASLFFDESKYWDLPEELSERAYRGTKLGSVPSWIQAPELPDMKFVGQFASHFEFHTALPDPNDIGCPVIIGNRKTDPINQRFEGPRAVEENNYRTNEGEPVWICEGANYGDVGMGYLFIESLDGSQLPKAEFVWQCS